MSKIVTLEELGIDPASVANQAIVYSKEIAGVTQLFVRASDGTVYQLTPTGGSGATVSTRPPGEVFDYLEDFVSGTDPGQFDFVTTGGSAIQLAPASQPWVGMAQFFTNNPNDTGYIKIGNLSEFMGVDSTRFTSLTVEWGGMFLGGGGPTLANDYTIRLAVVQDLTPVLVGGNNDCLSFSVGVAQNGNANLWAVMNNAQKIDLGVLACVPEEYHRYKIIWTPGVNVRWFVDDVLLGTFAGSPSIDGQQVNVGASIINGPGLNLPGLYLDYVWVHMELDRVA